MAVLDKNVLIFKYFEEICEIPHGSYHEEKIADYVENIAIENDLSYQRDDMNNIIIFKDATKGYEDHEPIILEGHMDMVNEKNNDSDHDFDNDPLDLYIKDGFLRARGTTLGADDGCGVAYMLALLTDKNVKHPPLECIFTVQEEVGLYGADGLDVRSLKGKRFIGLDSETEGETCTSSSGGCEVYIKKPIQGEDNESPVYTLEVKGLLGGHSGEYIDKGRGNANKIAGRILYHLLMNGIDVRLIEINGGLKDNAIPRECVVSFASESDRDDIYNIVEKCSQDIAVELEIGDPGFEVNLFDEECDVCITAKDSEAIISIIYLGYNGLMEKSQTIPGLTILSLNMGVVKTYDDYVEIHYSIRSPLESARLELCHQLKLIASLFNASVEMSGQYPGWNYDPHSQMRKQFKDFYKAYTGKELKEVATHGGLETGIFKNKIPDLDIVTMGPNMADIHTPDERLEIKSFLSTYNLLVKFIETL